MINRRDFLKTTGMASAGVLSLSALALALGGQDESTSGPTSMPTATPLLKISLAQWSLHNALYGGELTNLDFPVVTKRDFGIDAVEYVNSFMREESRKDTYVQELKKVCREEGVQSVLIMCDGEGRLGDPDKVARSLAVTNHHRWIEIAKELGCHSIRVNAASEGDWDTQRDLAADGLSQLTEYGAKAKINVIVENHGGLSSNGAWLSEVMRKVHQPMCGTLPDFGNFFVGGDAGPKRDGWYDIYRGVKELMPFAKAVSAKSHNFDESGNETAKDYMRILRIVLDAGYRGRLGIEYEGGERPEPEGIQLTKALIERCITALTPEYT
jgi:L-ribulose-5-phosphate 3-epimerase